MSEDVIVARNHVVNDIQGHVVRCGNSGHCSGVAMGCTKVISALQKATFIAVRRPDDDDSQADSVFIRTLTGMGDNGSWRQARSSKLFRALRLVGDKGTCMRCQNSLLRSRAHCEF